jgi:AraC-like DNA-binding protein
MQDDRLYLDPNLSLTKLARHVRVASNHVSQTLNEALEETFFDYVNRWRIEAALPHIAEGKETVLTIALDVGFNTRSTFYTAFKRVTGMTPRAYRETAKKTPG